jgi:zinc transporter ZupT
VVLKEIIHHIPEGIALGAIYAAHFMKTEWISSTVALVLAVAIAFQNIPEALYVSLWLREKGTKAGKSFLMGVASAAPIPILGIITVVLIVLFPVALPFIMSLSGGALIYTTIEEIPQIALKEDNDKGALAFTVGFAVVMFMIFV